MNSSPASASAAAAVSNALSLGKRKRPPMLPSAAKASFNVSNVVAAPQSDCRNARRPSPTRLACSPIRSSASLLARATCSVSGTGRNSPLDVASTLIGSGPLTSFVILSLLLQQILQTPLDNRATYFGLPASGYGLGRY